MIELIGIIACIIACIGTPIQTAKVRSGYVPPKFKGTPAEYRASYLKQVNMLMWVGVVLGVLMAGMAFIPTTRRMNGSPRRSVLLSGSR